MKLAVSILVKCPLGCGADLKPQAKHFHITYHCPKLKEQKQPSKPTGTREKVRTDKQSSKPSKTSTAPKCDCEGGGSWVMLNPQDKRHAMAMQVINPATGKPCRKYCTKCEEVY